MNKILRRSYKRQLKLMGTLFMFGVVSIPSAAQGFRDSLLLDFFGTEAAVENWKKSQKNTYSFSHLLQRPSVAKHFKNKKFGDHLFLEGGANLFLDMSERTNTSIRDISPWAYVGVGDWITPLHGWRLSLQLGQYNIGDKYSDVMGAGLDYLLNISAVAAQRYDKPNKFEFYGVAGTDWYTSKLNDTRDNAFGLHLGLRAQAYLSPYTYIYIEPRLGVYSPELVHSESWRKLELASSTLAGLGYALSPVEFRQREYTTSGSFLDNTFVSLAGGPSAIFNLGGTASMSQRIGGTGLLHFGKWFDSYSAMRLGLGISSRRQLRDENVRALSASVGYLWNMHNTFGGYNPDRKYWINAVADASMNVSSSGDGRKASFGFGVGLQPNLKLVKGVDLFLEPRADIYTKDFASCGGNAKDLDVTASLLAGIAFRQGLNTREQLLRNDNFENKTYYDHLFLDLGMSGIMPITNGLGKNSISHTGLGFYAGIGKWFNATSGLRLWGEMAKLEEMDGSDFDVFDFGADYMWNLTNALHGYNPQRPFDLIASAGINAMSKVNHGAFYLGANASLKGLYHLNDFVSFYLEPQARLYGSHAMEESTFFVKNTDVLTAMMAGVELTMNGYRPADQLPRFERYENNGFYSYAAGFGTTADASDTFGNYGIAGRFSYGNWLNPVSGLRANLITLVKPKNPYRYMSLTAGADYMADLTTLAYGFNPSRAVSVRGLAGVDMGFDIKSDRDYHPTHFVTHLRLGGQLAFPVGEKSELFVEPQLGYVIGGKPTTNDKERLVETVLLGMNHRMNALGSGVVNRNKNFKQETAYDHIFVDLGLGATMPISNEVGGQVFSHIRPSFSVGVGKWFNATSGLRLWGGTSKWEDVESYSFDLVDFGVDYLWNVTNALRGYQPDRSFNLIGTAGLNGLSKLKLGDFYVGASCGLRGQWRFNDMLSLYVEPQARFYGPNVLPESSFMFKNTDVVGTLLAGVELTMDGYRPSEHLSKFQGLDNHGFLSFAAGFGANASDRAGGKYKGFGGRLSYGNWWNPVSAWRANLNGLFNLKESMRYGYMTVGADYMADLTTLANGYRPDRRVYLRGLAGANLGMDIQAGLGRLCHIVGDMHVGGQLAYAVGNKNELFVEPQVSYMVAGKPRTQNCERLMGTVMLGVNHKMNALNSDLIKRNENFVEETPYDHMFVDMGIGAALPITSYVGNDLLGYMSPTLYAGVGKWFNATSGLRLWGEVAKFESIDKQRFEAIDVGVDYLWNMTNAFRGYDPDRNYELIGGLGLNALTKLHNRAFYVGANFTVKNMWHLNDLVSLFFEPQARLYGRSVLPISSFIFKKTDLIGVLMAGVQFKMNGYRPSAHQADYEEYEDNSFFSVAGGVTTSANNLSDIHNYGPVGRLSYGHWYTPVSAWRMNVTGLVKFKDSYRYAQMTVGADFMSDFTALAYGYNQDRKVNVRAIAGINMGADYKADTDEKAHFLADIHLGGQLALALDSKNEIYVEPQLAYVLGGKKTTNSNQRMEGLLMFGLNRKLKSVDREQISKVDRDVDDFVSVSLGTGLHTESIVERKTFVHKLTLDFDLSYGHWFNSMSGIRLGLSNTSVKLEKGMCRKNIMALHADYMFNILKISNKAIFLDTDWVLNGFAGLSFNAGFNKKMDATFAPGAQAGVELGYKLGHHWEVFAEPSGVLVGKKIWNKAERPVVFQTRLMLGTKYSF